MAELENEKVADVLEGAEVSARRGRLFMVLWRLLAILCIAAFCVAKSPKVAKALTPVRMGIGDIYRMVLVWDFNVPVPMPLKGPHPSPPINEAQIIAMGDSFMETHYGHRRLPTMLAESTGEKVFYHNMADGMDNPIQVLKTRSFERGEPRIFLLESIERYIPRRYGGTIDPDPPLRKKRSSLKKLYKEPWNFLFKDNDIRLQVFFKRSYPGYYLLGAANTTNFRLFGRMPADAPLYSLDPHVLFFRETVDDSESSYFHDHTDGEIEKDASVLAALSTNLKKRYNLTLVFMAVPNKITIYNHLVKAKPYDMFIPRLNAALAERGIPVVDVYTPMAASPDPLTYFESDTHWNGRGVSIAVAETVKTLDSMSRTENR